jgi:hypothetical protein
MAIHWKAVSTGARGGTWGELCSALELLPDGDKFRHAQAGDMPHKGGRILRREARQLASSSAHLDGWGYTHHRPTQANVDTLRMMAGYETQNGRRGLTMNLSADGLKDADRKAETGLPVVVVVDRDHPEFSSTPDGRAVVVCPVQTGKASSCAACMLCGRSGRKPIVGFRAHGATRKVSAIVAELDK